MFPFRKHRVFWRNAMKCDRFKVKRNLKITLMVSFRATTILPFLSNTPQRLLGNVTAINVICTTEMVDADDYVTLILVRVIFRPALN